MQFPIYRISTITAVGTICRNDILNLEDIFGTIYCDDNSKIDIEKVLYVEYCNSKNEVHIQGTHKKMYVKHRRVRSTKRFDNQATLLLQHCEKYNHNTTNMKVFKNGNVQMTGLKSIEQGERALQFMIDHILNISKNGFNALNNINNLGLGTIKICMINSDFKIGAQIKRHVLYNIIRRKYGTFCRFEPTCYAGVALQPMINDMISDPHHICRCSVPCDGKGCGSGNGNCKRVTIAIFGSGSIIITGSQSFDQLNTAYNYICNILKKNENEVIIPK